MRSLDPVLEVDEDPLPTPLTWISTSEYSQLSQKPKPLNFSRPLPAWRPSQSDVSSPRTEELRTSLDWFKKDDDEDVGVVTEGQGEEKNHDEDHVDEVDDAPPTPMITAPTQTNRASFDTERASICDSIDDAVPPPIGTNRAYAGRSSFDIEGASICESIDEAAPPPIGTNRTYANRDSFNIDRASMRDSIDEAVPPPIHTGSRTAGFSQHLPWTYDRGSQAAYTYKPHTGDAKPYEPSIASTAETNETYDSYEPAEMDDTQSIADSEASGHSVATAHSSASDLTFNGQMGLPPRLPSSLAESQSQRWSASTSQRPSLISRDTPPIPRKSSHRAAHKGSVSTTASKAGLSLLQIRSTASSTASSSGAAPPPLPAMIPRIVKRTSVDQMSEHVSPASDRGGSVSSNEWSSSDHDTSGLSVEKIHKLKKKGINPALYVEMKNARKGKGKWINPLGGNSFLS